MTARRLRAIWPHATWATPPGASASTGTACPAANCSRSKYATVAAAEGAMVATKSVASAIPYEGLKAVDGKPKGANTLLKVLIASMLTGSDPMIITTLLRSMPESAAGTPRWAAHSYAKFGAAVTTRPSREPADRAWIQRCGLRMNAVGDSSVE